MPDKEYTPLLTEADHEAGYKDLPALTRSGKTITVRLTPPPAMRAAKLFQDHIADKQNFLPLLEESAPTEALKNLSLESIDELCLYAVALAYGAATEKKIVQPLRELKANLDKLSDANLERLLDQVSASAKSGTGRSPSFDSGSVKSTPRSMNAPFSISTSPPPATLPPMASADLPANSNQP